ncbi:hypothetical protein ACF0H5_018320 [Mactra antiquata]
MVLNLWILIFCFVYSYVGATTSAPKCDDVDASACVLLQAQQTDFCKNDVVARSICPRFCKMCPVECYHCDTTFTDYHKCNTTILCQDGEVCMRKELISFMDGHHEYEMTCQDRRICDGGSDLTIPFGKRNVNARDISIKCCIDDLCNYPEVTTTTSTTTTTTTTTKPSCPKDIYFMVDVAKTRLLQQHDAPIKDLITSVIGQLDIGMTDNLVSYHLFDDKLHTKFPLTRYTDKKSVISHINSYSLYNTSTTTHHNASLAIKTLLSYATRSTHTWGGHILGLNDRPGYPDVVIIIGNWMTTSNLHMSSSELHELQQFSRDVIVVDINSASGNLHHFFNRSHDDQLATDSNHIINTSYSDLNLQENQIADQLYQLIIEC